MPGPRILVFAGSIRTGSWNQKLADLAAATIAEAGGAVRAISLKDYPLPLYDADLQNEKGIPRPALALHALFRESAGIFIASPEYNAGITPLLKNTIDWVSRVGDFGGMTAAFAAPVFALGGVGSGRYGGYRGLGMLRQSLTLGLNALVIPEMVAVPNGAEAFDEQGRLRDERSAQFLVGLAGRLVREAALRTA